MKNLVFVGQFRDASGYASAARGYLEILSELERESGYNLFTLSINFEQKNSAPDSVLDLIEKHEIKTKAIVDKIQESDYSVLWHLPPPVMTWMENLDRLPPQLKESFRLFKTLIDNCSENHSITTWETDKIPSYWKGVLEKHNTKINFVPSRWNCESYKKTGIETELLPHYISPVENTAKKAVKLPSLDGKFTFFAMSQWGHRKGFEPLLRAYFSEFKSQTDVALVIKTYVDNTSKEGSTAFKQIADQIKTIKAGVFTDEKNTPPACPVYVLVDVLSREKINYLYDVSDCFVLATRGEGFGLTIAEAASFNKPVIVPDKGGHVDYLEPNALMFGCHLAPCYKLPNYECGSNYYEPDVLSLMEKMRYAFDNREELAAIAKNNSKKLSDHCGKDNIKRILTDSFSFEKATPLISSPKSTTNRLKSKLSSMESLEKKVSLLKDSYKGDTCYILNCGPSLKDYSRKQLKEKLSDKLVFAVKQAYEYCPEVVDFHFFNCSNLPSPNAGVHYDYKESNPIVVGSSNYDKGMRWSALQHDDLFFKIPIRTEIDNEFLAVTKKFEDYPLEAQRPCGPGIMYETVIQTAVHLGVKKIVVLGWDLTYNKVDEDNYKHFYGNTQGLVNRGDILDWEIETTRAATKEMFYWLKESGISLTIVSDISSLYEGILREKL
jgi:glycosyltransferase involved in cell wall biosynthesis